MHKNSHTSNKIIRIEGSHIPNWRAKPIRSIKTQHMNKTEYKSKSQCSINEQKSDKTGNFQKFGHNLPWKSQIHKKVWSLMQCTPTNNLNKQVSIHITHQFKHIGRKSQNPQIFELKNPNFAKIHFVKQLITNLAKLTCQ